MFLKLKWPYLSDKNLTIKVQVFYTPLTKFCQYFCIFLTLIDIIYLGWQKIDGYAILVTTMPGTIPSQNHKKNGKRKIVKVKFNLSWKNVFLYGFLLLFLMFLFAGLNQSVQDAHTVPLSQVLQDTKAGKVKSITVEDTKLTVVEKDKTVISTKEASSNVYSLFKDAGIPLDKTKIEVKDNTGVGNWINLISSILPIILMVAFFYFIFRQARGAQESIFSFGQSKAKLFNKDQPKTTFADVAGVDEAKQELTEIVDFLKHPEKYKAMGARAPKGVLMVGPSGTGKTLLARATAGEAGTTFFSMAGSEFMEMLVGVGASRVRDLFATAKKNQPAIIFIDEIDAIGRQRGAGLMGGHDEREQTLNQILVEMDGFESNEGVILIAATNRPDVLDPALLRPGRFDRRVTIDLPDRDDREAILNVHARQKPLAEDVVLRVIAERTPGFSGADLYSLMNEGAILAARENRTKVSQYDLIRSIEKVMLGPERRSHLLGKKEKELTAYHEAGHALIASVLKYADPVHKVSIISRGRAAGYTLKLPLEDKKLQSKNEFLDDIAVSLGGYVVEKNIFNDLTTGSSNDLQVSTALARDMVTKYGMSDKIGPVALEGMGGRTIGGGQGMNDREFSENVGTTIDAEVSRIMNEAYTIAHNIVTEHRKVLDAIAKELVEKETIERAEFEQILIANGITPKKKDILSME